MGIDKDTERLLKDLRGELLFRTMTRREKDRAIDRINAILAKEIKGFFHKLLHSKIGFRWGEG